MYPLANLWGFPVASWYLAVSISLFVSYFYLIILSKKLKFYQFHNHLDFLFVGGTCFGWLGARGLSVLVEQFEVRTWADGFLELFKPGPLTFYGGFLGGGFFLILVGVFFLSIPFQQLVVCGSPALILGLSIGRIGCFLNGDDYGAPIPDEAPLWAVVFPNLNDGIPRYPVQLEETLVNGIFLFIFHKWISKNPKDAYMMALFLFALSACNRFVVEFYRGDHRGRFFSTPLSTSQGIALLIVGSCLLLAVAHLQKNRSMGYDTSAH